MRKAEGVRSIFIITMSVALIFVSMRPTFEAKYAEVQERGDVKITSAIVPIARNTRSFYTEDPDGVPVEFVQRTR